LREESVQKPPAFFAAAGDDLHVVGGDDDTGQAAYMLGETLAGLVIGKELFFAVFPQDTDHFQRLTLLFKLTLNAEASGAFVYIELVLSGKIAFGKAQVINGVEQIGLPNAIATADAYDPLVKLEGGLFVVFELYQ